jgi:hypothetical protein
MYFLLGKINLNNITKAYSQKYPDRFPSVAKERLSVRDSSVYPFPLGKDSSG